MMVKLNAVLYINSKKIISVAVNRWIVKGERKGWQVDVILPRVAYTLQTFKEQADAENYCDEFISQHLENLI